MEIVQSTGERRWAWRRIVSVSIFCGSSGYWGDQGAATETFDLHILSEHVDSTTDMGTLEIRADDSCGDCSDVDSIER